MYNHRRLIGIVIIIIFLQISIHQLDVLASDWDGEYTDQDIPAGNWYKVYWTDISQGSQIYGYFETYSEDQEIKFFICDSENMDIYESGGTADVYNLEEDIHYLQYSFSIPYTDTWYTVYSNDGGSESVTVDVGVDIGEDSTPSYSSTIYDYTEYGQVIEPGWFRYYHDYFSEGTVLSGHVSTWFSTDGIDLFFCDEENYERYSDGLSATVYEKKENMHQASIGDFTVPYDDTWYLIISAVDASDTVTISYGLTISEPGVTTTTPLTTTTTTTRTTDTEEPSMPTMVIIAGVVGVVAIIAIAAIVISRSRKREEPDFSDMDVIIPGQD